MRAYFLCNYYLSSVQQGIQAAHCVADMFCRYGKHSQWQTHEMLYTWAKDHKTMILLNGGNHKELETNFYNIQVMCEALGYPYGIFAEDQQSLNGAITCVGLVVEPHIYQTKVHRDERTGEFIVVGYDDNDLSSTTEIELAYLLQSKSLAK